MTNDEKNNVDVLEHIEMLKIYNSDIQLYVKKLETDDNFQFLMSIVC